MDLKRDLTYLSPPRKGDHMTTEMKVMGEIEGIKEKSKLEKLCNDKFGWNQKIFSEVHWKNMKDLSEMQQKVDFL